MKKITIEYLDHRTEEIIENNFSFIVTGFLNVVSGEEVRILPSSVYRLIVEEVYEEDHHIINEQIKGAPKRDGE